MRRKKVTAVLLTAAVVFSMMGCRMSKAMTETTEEKEAAGASEASAGTQENEKNTEDGEEATIEFWYHDGNDVSNAYWADIISKNDVRMEVAMKLLKKGDKRIYKVAFCTGSNSSQYFSRKFKKHFGVEPREVKHQNVS